MSRADIQERARLLDQIDRLNALFGSRFHLDSSCGSCGGPLECDRDAICHRCTNKMEIERLQATVDRLQAIVDRLPKTVDGVPIYPGMTVWGLIPGHGISDVEVQAVGIGGVWRYCYSTREAAEKARAT